MFTVQTNKPNKPPIPPEFAPFSLKGVQVASSSESERSEKNLILLELKKKKSFYAKVPVGEGGRNSPWLKLMWGSKFGTTILLVL